ncbi:MAG: zinc ribbon domain-containing protein [Siculibacillus sp.]|nr:zinc ribbon domain-containing protein [Siculibacillus sp.]
MAHDDIAISPDLRTTLDRADLAAFLDLHGRPGPITLRPEEPAAPPDAPVRLRLAAAGLLAEREDDPAAARAAAIARTLLAPTCVITLSLWNDAQEGRTTLAFPGRPVGGGGVMVERDGADVRLAAFLEAEGLLALVEPLLSIVPATPSARLEARLARPSAVVLAGLADLTAQADDDTPAFTARHVADWLTIWWGASRRTDLTGQVFALTFDPDPPDGDRVAAELDAFAAAGLVDRDDGGRFRPIGDFVAVSHILAVAGGGFDLHRLDVATDGSVAGRLVHVVCGGEGAFVLERLAGDRIALRVAGRIDLAGLVADLATAGGREAEPVGEPTAPRVAEPPAATRRRFCTRCGARVEADWSFCTGCGAPLVR